MKRIAVVPGDGIGIDVTRESMRVLRRVNEVFSAGLEFVEFDWGAEKYLKEGIALPPGAFEMFRKDFQAILFGAVGDPRVPDQKHAAEILLALRFGLDLYANVRPVRLAALRTFISTLVGWFATPTTNRDSHTPSMP